jgi:hypothetical protein
MPPDSNSMKSMTPVSLWMLHPIVAASAGTAIARSAVRHAVLLYELG